MFIPIRDDQPTLRPPHFTIALILINSAVFLYTKTLGYEGFQNVLVYFGYIPDLVLESDQYLDVPHWLYATPFTSMFLHGGWMHLIGNMLFLWIYGNNIEDYFGSIRFILFYLISGIAAIALYTLFNPNSQVPLVGASGAIAGVMGAYYVLHPQARITILIVFFFIMLREFPAKVVLGFWFVYQILMSTLDLGSGGGVAWLAHVGGFVFGYLLLRLLLAVRGRRRIGSDQPRIYRMQW
ncbi:MAG: rhomboid family intramembrane serine protease [Candidatus Zixiibacteriota bacterium]